MAQGKHFTWRAGNLTRGLAPVLLAGFIMALFASGAFLSGEKPTMGTLKPPNEQPAPGPKKSPGTELQTARRATTRNLRLMGSALAFEPLGGKSPDPSGFVTRGGAYALSLVRDEMVLALRSQESGVRSQKGSRQLSVLSRQWQRTTDNELPTGLSNSLFTIRHSPFQLALRTQNSEFSQASSLNPLASSFVRLSLIGANPNPKFIGLDKLKGKSNYFIGNDPKKWRTNVPNYARVMVKNVYPGIDQIFYGKDGQLEYDFIVHPGADPKQIRLAAETQEWKLEIGKWKLATGNRPLLSGHKSNKASWLQELTSSVGG